ncbi:PREDICTED: uncharacterized protein LOC107063864 [Polistes dominula]|uniref:Uncharacterized protein LOC107063864 n=1 Tax=Polistes dominula TaxID=743375 RepID=A0ABM1HU38_POLDO|nr:PREDICTED: uncharacterized protein LOC107063864 [Polistes dominula]
MCKERTVETYHIHYKFDHQTQMILHSLNADHLIKSCKERNISTKDLHNLTVDDFIELGANENQAKELFNNLTSKKKSNVTQKWPIMRKYENIIETLNNNKKQLDLISVGVAYVRLTLEKKGINNTFINSRDLITVNTILCTSITENLNAVKDLEKAIEECSALIPKNITKKKEQSFISLPMLFAGLGLILCQISRIRKN